MLNLLFDEDAHRNMIDHFLDHLAPLGNERKFRKGTIIDPFDSSCVYIVTSGYFKQVLISGDGREVSLFRLQPGTVFGEMDYFSGARTIALTKALVDSTASCLAGSVLEKELKKHPHLYRQFIQSIIRKYRIILMKTARTMVNDSKGRICGLLLELSAQFGNDVDKPSEIDYVYTHQELANATGCSRITITNVLNELKDEGLITYKGKNIFIANPDGLKRYYNTFW
ncbi:MAG: Crp/Fnr family transcriptional regulator [Acetomicrobium sp.]